MSGYTSGSPSPLWISLEYVKTRLVILDLYQAKECVRTRPSHPSPHYVESKKFKESEDYLYNGEVLPRASIVPLSQIDQGGFPQEKRSIYHAPLITSTDQKSVKYKEQEAKRKRWLHF